LRIIIVSTFFSEGMGYSENCLPKALAGLGHEIHVITSNLNVYGNSEDYHKTYASFLGPADSGTGVLKVDGYTVHRLPSKVVFGYIYITKIAGKIKNLSPEIVHTTAIEAYQAFMLAFLKPFFNYKLFAESHQHMSVVKPYMKNAQGKLLKRIFYRLTRTLPSYLSSLTIETCYAISPDCAEVANKYYGVPQRKIRVHSLGTDTELFQPASSENEIKERIFRRTSLGYQSDDIVCIYSGRFSEDKNPLLLAKSIEYLSNQGMKYYGLFIGDGIQKSAIQNCKNVTVLPFMRHIDLAEYYKLADIAVWPTQESMSMLDAASSGLPLVVSDKIGEYERVEGNGKVYKEGNMEDLCDVLKSLSSKETRHKYGQIGRKKMVDNYSWVKIAREVESDYFAVVSKRNNI